MNVNEVYDFLSNLVGTNRQLRVSIIVSESEAQSMLARVKGWGYFGMLRSSQFGDIELVVSDENIGSTRSEASSS